MLHTTIIATVCDPMRLRKLGRNAAHRWGLMRNLVDALLVHERIRTTLPKAKELRRVGDRVVRFGKAGSEDARGRARAWLRTDDALQKLFNVIGPRFKDRQGGYTRVERTAPRLGDNAPMAFVSYLGWDEQRRTADGGFEHSRATLKTKRGPM